MSQIEFDKFVTSPPSDINALSILAGRWWSPVDGDGSVVDRLDRFFSSDQRAPQAAEALGRNGRLDKMSVLELGPLEANHTYYLEKLGARVTAVEGNAEAFMKCLIMKEVLNLDARFRLGNFVPMLENSPDRYDMIYASGVLYHMSDPLHLLRLVADRTDSAYFWTHYYDPASEFHFVPEQVNRHGMDVVYHRVPNSGSGDNSRWWGGLFESACWLQRSDIIEACHKFGYSRVEVLQENADPGGFPSFGFACSR